MNKAFIDLGTNTFHLLIVSAESKKAIFKTSIPARLGEGGINKQILTEAGIDRALNVLRIFREKMNEHNVTTENTVATATSAVRNANNQGDFVKQVLEETGIAIEVISGDEEATLIYEGVQQAVAIAETSLIIDIGGGSVEFIIANKNGILWKHSFEIGGQRLMELFMKTDPISHKAVERLDSYFLNELIPLANAIHQYRPMTLIGSSGSFDTLNAIHLMKTDGQLPDTGQVGFDYPLTAFYDSYEKLLFSDRLARMAIPGMVELRVDMIVVAVCLIRFVVQTHGIEKIKISNYALKEGLMRRYL